MFLGKSKFVRQESRLGSARKWDPGLEAICDESYDPTNIYRKEWEFCGEEAGQTTPPSVLLRNNRSALEHSSFVTKAIKELSAICQLKKREREANFRLEACEQTLE